MCAFTTMLELGIIFRTAAAAAEPGVVFVMTKSCFRPRLAPNDALVWLMVAKLLLLLLVGLVVLFIGIR